MEIVPVDRYEEAQRELKIWCKLEWVKVNKNEKKLSSYSESELENLYQFVNNERSGTHDVPRDNNDFEDELKKRYETLRAQRESALAQEQWIREYVHPVLQVGGRIVAQTSVKFCQLVYTNATYGTFADYSARGIFSAGTAIGLNLFAMSMFTFIDYLNYRNHSGPFAALTTADAHALFKRRIAGHVAGTAGAIGGMYAGATLGAQLGLMFGFGGGVVVGAIVGSIVGCISAILVADRVSDYVFDIRDSPDQPIREAYEILGFEDTKVRELEASAASLADNSSWTAIASAAKRLFLETHPDKMLQRGVDPTSDEYKENRVRFESVVNAKHFLRAHFDVKGWNTNLTDFNAATHVFYPSTPDENGTFHVYVE